MNKTGELNGMDFTHDGNVRHAMRAIEDAAAVFETESCKLGYMVDHLITDFRRLLDANERLTRSLNGYQRRTWPARTGYQTV